MKLSAFFLTVACLQVNASAVSQNISLSVDNAPMEQVIKLLKKRSGFMFIYSNELLKKARPVTMNVIGGSLEQVLEQCFNNQPLTYKIIEKTIVVAPRITAAISEQTQTETQDVQVKGKVTDERDEALPGVSILIRGTQRGTTTDAEGRFNISVPNAESVLVFSFVGFVTQEVNVGNHTSLNIRLAVDTEALEEVVVVGYGTMRKTDLTGAIATAPIESFREQPNINVLQSLQGSVPGLNVGMATRAGDNPSFSIRGQNTISGSSAPLIVVDDVIYRGDLQDINGSDVESINVLKDASSAAIYGSQAANGVIIITTKKGKEKGKPIVSYSGKYAISNELSPIRLYDETNFYKLAQALDWRNSFLAPAYTAPNPAWDVERLLSRAEVEALNNNLSTDWWDRSTRTGSIHSHDLSISGRSTHTSYFVSGSYSDQKEILLNDDFKRFTGRINLENAVFDWLSIGTNVMLVSSNRPNTEVNLANAYHLSPLSVPYDALGQVNTNPVGTSITNPLLPLGIDYKETRNHLNGNVFAKISVPFVEGLSYRISYGNSTRSRFEYRFDPTFSNFTGRANRNFERNQDWTLDNVVSYQKLFKNKHRMDITLLYGRESRKGDNTISRGDVFENQILGYNGMASAQVYNVAAGAYEETSLYSMGRLNYSLLNRYLATFTIRRDGFSGFGKGNKFGIFPSLAAGWNISEETFFKRMSLPVNLFKVRMSYGRSGNRTLGRYATLARVEVQDAYVFGDKGTTEKGQRITSLDNPSLGWETTTGTNVGTDFSLFSGRLHGNAEYYISNTDGLIYTINLPSVSGFSSISTNIGKIHNTGFELSISSINIEKKNFLWSTTLNFSQNRNQVRSILGVDNNGDGKEDDLVASNIFIGEPLNTIYGYEINGIYQVDDEIPLGFAPGYYRINDLNGDGLIKPDHDRKILGYSDPAYRYGIFNEARYHNFTLRVNINSIQGGKNRYLGENAPYKNNNDQAGSIKNRSLDWDYWTPANPDAEYPSISYNPAIVPVTYRQRSFVRLQDLSLGYSLKSTIIQKMGLKNLKVFLSGKNLYTWTKWKGVDPETGGGLHDARPVSRSIAIGFDVSL